MKKTLEDLREEIRRKDLAIVKLLNERARISVDVGKIKNAGAQEIYDPSQESRIYEHLTKINEGPLPEAALKEIFREIISSSRALQGPIRVAYLGPEATFSQLAALTHFGKSARLLPVASIHEVFAQVEGEKADWGVVPLENSIEGSIKQTLDRLIATPLSIRAEIFLRISHCLLSICGDLSAVTHVYSIPQALAQCQGWLRTHLPGCRIVETESTAGGAKRALEDPQGAAIGSALAAETYGLKILSEGIEDYPLNTTRFLVIGRGRSEATGKDKTSVVFGTPDLPGSLHTALEPFAREALNMMRIESYPLRDRMWEYVFFVDLAGHCREEKIAGCLDEMKKVTTFIKVLGSYPRGNGQ
jgi:chorismate mutase/prephenate dehydratase